MPKKYSIIYADPPWSYDSGMKDRGGVETHYASMTIDGICGLPVENIAADDCILFVWATFPKLFEAKEVIQSWGFEYKTCAFVWVKTNKRANTKQYSFLPQDSFDSFWGMGRWTRANAELCLLATRGKPQRINADVHQLIYAPIGRHSEKPAETREKIIRLVGDLPRVELFARAKRAGWDAWGNEINPDLLLAI